MKKDLNQIDITYYQQKMRQIRKKEMSIEEENNRFDELVNELIENYKITLFDAAFILNGGDMAPDKILARYNFQEGC